MFGYQLVKGFPPKVYEIRKTGVHIFQPLYEARMNGREEDNRLPTKLRGHANNAVRGLRRGYFRQWVKMEHRT